MGARIHKAGWIMVEPGTWIENGEVTVFNGRIEALGKAVSRGGSLDHGPGVIMTSLINAHTHLSLSNLVGRIPPRLGFVEWVKKLIAERDDSHKDEIAAAAENAARTAKESGTGFLADVGPWKTGAQALERAGLDGMVFEEVLGNTEMFPVLPCVSNGIRFSYAGHALHTTAPGVLRKLKAHADRCNTPFSIHLAESEAEVEFLAGVRGSWADLLASRGVAYGSWDIRSERPMVRAQRLGLLSPGTLAVHALQVDSKEMSVMAETGVSLCVCPRSNLALHGRLPKIGAFLSAGLLPALGTDSLASVSSLSLFDEMAFVSENYPHIKPETILAMATTYGAQALGRPDLGSVEPGSEARLIYVDVAARSAHTAATKLTTGDFNDVRWL